MRPRSFFIFFILARLNTEEGSLRKRYGIEDALESREYLPWPE
jgi:hypothetical protein